MGSLIFDLTIGNKTLEKNYLFKDLRTDLRKDSKDRDIDTSIDENAINNSITNMFLFSPGERIIQPEFGNNLYQYVYEPITDLTAKKLGREILSMFERWEARVEILDLIITPFPDDNLYHVQVIYTIPSLNDRKLSFDYSINVRRN